MPLPCGLSDGCTWGEPCALSPQEVCVPGFSFRIWAEPQSPLVFSRPAPPSALVSGVSSPIGSLFFLHIAHCQLPGGEASGTQGPSNDCHIQTAVSHPASVLTHVACASPQVQGARPVYQARNQGQLMVLAAASQRPSEARGQVGRGNNSGRAAGFRSGSRICTRPQPGLLMQPVCTWGAPPDCVLLLPHGFSFPSAAALSPSRPTMPTPFSSRMLLFGSENEFSISPREGSFRTRIPIWPP